MDNYNSLIQCGGDKLYCLIFQNKYGLLKNEVEEIFSLFGEVCDIRFVGNKTGHCFVRYRSFDDAKRAVDKLKTYPKIQLLPHKKKQNNNSSSDGSQKSNQEQKRCDGTSFIRQFGRQANNIDMSAGNKNGNQNGVFVNNGLPRGTNKENQSISNVNNNLPREPKNTNGIQKQNNLPRRPVNRQANFNRAPGLPDHSRRVMSKMQNQEDEIPELVTSSGKKLRGNSHTQKIILAQEVIVANIHPKFGASYILHLFDCFDPLAITKIMVEPKTGKRYCHVYFKSAEQSQQIEALFDKKALLGQKLVVLRSKQLIESAYFK